MSKQTSSPPVSQLETNLLFSKSSSACRRAACSLAAGLLAIFRLQRQRETKGLHFGWLRDLRRPRAKGTVGQGNGREFHVIQRFLGKA